MEKENILPADYVPYKMYPLLPKSRSMAVDERHPDSKSPLFESSKVMVGGTFTS